MLLERGGRLGEPWRGRYDRLHLHTIRWLSGLPGYRIPRGAGRWVSRDAFVD
jgi:cation diffusion facilitator CzcD-associated flavoprotein CzcO